MNLHDALKRELKEFGHDITESGPELRAFAAAEALQLAALSGRLGYERALEASVDRIMMKVGLVDVGLADSADRRSRALIRGFLIGAAGAAL